MPQTVTLVTVAREADGGRCEKDREADAEQDDGDTECDRLGGQEARHQRERFPEPAARG